MQDYHNLRVWKKAHDLAIGIHRLAKSFPRGYGSLRSQLMRSAESVPFTIVEGCGAASPKEFARFLDMSIKSLSELEEQLQMGCDYGIISSKNWRSHSEDVRIIRKMTWTLRERVLGNDPSKSSCDETTEIPITENRKRNATENALPRVPTEAGVRNASSP